MGVICRRMPSRRKAQPPCRFHHTGHLCIHDRAAPLQNVGISTKDPAPPRSSGRARPADRPESDWRHDRLIGRDVFTKGGIIRGSQPRPCALPGRFPQNGTDEDDRYLAHRSVFNQDPEVALPQTGGNQGIFANRFVSPHDYLIHMRPRNDVSRAVCALNNTVPARGEGIAIRVREAFTWPGKVFASTPLAGGEAAGKRVGRYDETARFLRVPCNQPLHEMDPAPCRVMRPRAIQPSTAPAFPPADLNGRLRARGKVEAFSAATGKLKCPGGAP